MKVDKTQAHSDIADTLEKFYFDGEIPETWINPASFADKMKKITRQKIAHLQSYLALWPGKSLTHCPFI